jgi:GNAT superfamily N-acetyltransferase
MSQGRFFTMLLATNPHRSVSIRQAEETDFGRVLALARAFGTTGAVDDSLMAVTFIRLVSDPNVFLGVADDGAKLLGYVLAQDYLPGLRSDFATGRIHDLFVEPTARGRGVGRTLMEVVKQWADSRPHPIILDWQAPAKSAGFYQALGYMPDYIGDIAEYPEFSIDTRPAT